LNLYRHVCTMMCSRRRQAMHEAGAHRRLTGTLVHLVSFTRSPHNYSHPRLSQSWPKMAGVPLHDLRCPPSPPASHLRWAGFIFTAIRRGMLRGAQWCQPLRRKPHRQQDFADQMSPLSLCDWRVGSGWSWVPTVSDYSFGFSLFLFKNLCKFWKLISWFRSV
jgi:hypothetical protein